MFTHEELINLLSISRQQDSERILRFPDVKKMTGLSRTTIWRLEKQDAFPKTIKITGHVNGWLEREIKEWISSKMEARNLTN